MPHPWFPIIEQPKWLVVLGQLVDNAVTIRINRSSVLNATDEYLTGLLSALSLHAFTVHWENMHTGSNRLDGYDEFWGEVIVSKATLFTGPWVDLVRALTLAEVTEDAGLSLSESA